MRPDQYENIIDCLLELIHNQNRIINGFQLQEARETMRERGDSKLRTFINAFETVMDKEKQVGVNNLTNVLQGAGFTEEEVSFYIDKALKNGQIYERKTGVYARV